MLMVSIYGFLGVPIVLFYNPLTLLNPHSHPVRQAWPFNSAER